MVLTLVSLGKIYSDNKNNEKAKECYDKALLIGDRIYEKADDCRLDLMCKVGEFYYQQGDRKTTQEIFLSVLELNRKKHGPSGTTLRIHPATANYFLGLLEFDVQNYEKALERLTLSAKFYRTVTSVDSPRTAIAIASIGKVHVALENWEKARENLEYAAAVFTSFGMERELEPLEEIHKEVLKHIPGAVHRPMVYQSDRNGVIKQIRIEEVHEKPRNKGDVKPI